jgi:hypothetical protein
MRRVCVYPAGSPWSHDRANGKSALHMVSAWGCEQRVVLGQIATDEKSNEITAVPKLLEILSLRNTVVTTDALNRQRAIAQQIVDHEARNRRMALVNPSAASS